MKLRTKIIAAFLSLIFVPALTVTIVVLLFSSGYIKFEPLTDILSIEKNSQMIERIVMENFDALTKNPSHSEGNNEATLRSLERDIFDKKLQEYIKSSFSRVIVLDSKNVVLYDSLYKLDGMEYDSIYNLKSKTSGFSSEIAINGKFKGLIIYIPLITDDDVLKLITMTPLIMVGIFLLMIITMIVLLSKLLTDGILKPLNELTRAAEHIANGDLDFEIQLKTEDELGLLCNEFDKMRQRLKYTLDKQARYERSRKQLIASISHDLKTPLTSIKGYIEGLQDGIATDQETHDRYLEVIHTKAVQLNRLIDDLFTFSKLELNEFQIDLEYMNANALMDHATQHYSVEYHDAPFEIRCITPFDSGILRVDEKRIMQVIDNIVDNASKFTNSFIRISSSTGDDHYCIHIEDDGDGISPSDLPYIFDHFYKVDKSRNTARKGTGLGLAICKQLVEAHGGHIHVESTRGTGTHFKVCIPLQNK